MTSCFEDRMVENPAVAYALGAAAFGASHYYARGAEPKDPYYHSLWRGRHRHVVHVLRHFMVLRLLIAAILLLLAPMLVVAFYNLEADSEAPPGPVANPMTSFSGNAQTFTLSWNFGFARPIVNGISLTVGYVVQAHHCIRLWTFLAICGCIICDTFSEVDLHWTYCCVSSGSCPPLGAFSTTSIFLLMVRDLMSLGLLIWAMLELCYIFVEVGAFSTILPKRFLVDGGDGMNRARVMIQELAKHGIHKHELHEFHDGDEEKGT